MSAPFGNQFAVKPKIIRDALQRAIRQDDGERVRQAVEKLLDAAAAGDIAAFKELRDSLGEKPAQAVVGPDGESIFAPLLLSAQMLRTKIKSAEVIEIEPAQTKSA